MRFKAMINSRCRELGVTSQVLHRSFMFERFLERLAASEHWSRFIIKGGFLISSIVGLSARTTMDIDATLKGTPLSIDTVSELLHDICNIDTGDGVAIKVRNIEKVQEGKEYSGLRVRLQGRFETIDTPFSLDLTTGDAITPYALEYSYKPVFGDKEIVLFAYNLETVLAEKIETVLSRGTANTRMRDYFDVYILNLTRKQEIDMELLGKAIKATSENRGSTGKISNWRQTIISISADTTMNEYWDRYRKSNHSCSEISFQDTCLAVSELMSLVTKR